MRGNASFLERLSFLPDLMLYPGVLDTDIGRDPAIEACGESPILIQSDFPPGIDVAIQARWYLLTRN